MGLKVDKKCGMNTQAWMFLQYLSEREFDISAEESANAWLSVSPYSNCRERGFVLTLKRTGEEYLQFAFYEHRNSDDLCCVKWEGRGNITGGFTPDDIPEGVFNSKHDYAKSWGYMQLCDAFEWLEDQIKTAIGMSAEVSR